MKCKYCGKEISEPVYPLHTKRCKKLNKVESKDYNEEELFDKTNEELRNILESQDKPTYGAKKELVKRIVGD